MHANRFVMQKIFLHYGALTNPTGLLTYSRSSSSNSKGFLTYSRSSRSNSKGLLTYLRSSPTNSTGLLTYLRSSLTNSTGFLTYLRSSSSNSKGLLTYLKSSRSNLSGRGEHFRQSVHPRRESYGDRLMLIDGRRVRHSFKRSSGRQVTSPAPGAAGLRPFARGARAGTSPGSPGC
jgi:hypothetical protein